MDEASISLPSRGQDHLPWASFPAPQGRQSDRVHLEVFVFSLRNVTRQLLCHKWLLGAGGVPQFLVGYRKKPHTSSHSLEEGTQGCSNSIITSICLITENEKVGEEIEMLLILCFPVCSGSEELRHQARSSCEELTVTPAAAEKPPLAASSWQPALSHPVTSSLPSRRLFSQIFLSLSLRSHSLPLSFLFCFLFKY